MTRKGGDVRILADQSVDLFTSRVFTLPGGDVTIRASYGSITAGAGSKTTAVRPAAAFTLANDALSILNVFGLPDRGGHRRPRRRRGRYPQG